MQLSTRNQWKGIVKSVNHGSTVSEIALEISPQVSVTAIVSKHSAIDMNLEVGKEAYALIKSTEVTLGVD